MSLIDHQVETPKRGAHWSQILSALVSLSVFIFSVWQKAGVWAYVLTGVASIALLLLIAKDLHLYAALKRWRTNIVENGCARKSWKDYQKIVERAQRPLDDLRRRCEQCQVIRRQSVVMPLHALRSD